MEKELKFFRLTSDCVSYGPMPKETDIVLQRITMHLDGRTMVSVYEFGNGHPYRLKRTKRCRISAEKAALICDRITSLMQSEDQPTMVTDVGSWILRVDYTDGSHKSLRGSLIGECSETVELSNLLRQYLGNYALAAFDGGADWFASFDEVKEMIAELSELGNGVEFGFYLKDHDYMIIQYEDRCTIQRCGESAEIANGEQSFSSLDEMYEAQTIDGICLKDCWNQIESMTIEGNTIDEYPYIVEAYEQSEAKRAYREARKKGTEAL